MEYESILNIDYSERTLNIYTSYPTLARRMKKKGYEPTKIFFMDGNEEGWEWEFPLSEVGKFMRSGLFKVRPNERNIDDIQENETSNEEEPEE